MLGPSVGYSYHVSKFDDPSNSIYYLRFVKSRGSLIRAKLGIGAKG